MLEYDIILYKIDKTLWYCFVCYFFREVLEMIVPMACRGKYNKKLDMMVRTFK